ncbi:MAG TPA: glycosyltransferase [Candidatus Limnocylindrales bacterium]|nr:glycosyltransferase [Candidatus Limnocylindrales bacterium]
MRLIVDLRVLHVPNWQLHHYPLRLTRALSRIPGIDVTAVVQTGRVRPRVAGRLLGPTVHVALIDAAIGSREQDRAWADLISQRGADAVLIPYLPGAPRPRSVPTILVVAALPPPSSESGAVGRIVAQLVTRRVVRGARAVIVPSATVGAALRLRYGRSLPISVVRPGTSMVRVRASRRDDKAPIHLPPRSILAVGPAADARAFHTLVSGFKRVADDDRSLGLVLLGPIERVVADSIALLAGDLGISDQVLVLDEVGDEQLSTLLGTASCFAVASSLDHLAPLLPDALAAGLPTVASDVSSVRDVSGTAAILVPPGDIAAWEAALEAILTDEALTTRLSQAARGERRSWAEAAREVAHAVVSSPPAGTPAPPRRRRSPRGASPRWIVPPALGASPAPSGSERRLRYGVLALAILAVVGAFGVRVLQAPISERLPAVRAAAWIVPNLVLRAAQPRDVDFVNLRDTYGVRGVVNLRSGGIVEEVVVEDLGLSYLSLTLPDRGAPGPSQLRRLVNYVSERALAGDVVLVHDETGTDRAPAVAILLDMLHGTPTDRAILRISSTTPEALDQLSTDQIIAINALADALGFEPYLPPGYEAPPDGGSLRYPNVEDLVW